MAGWIKLSLSMLALCGLVGCASHPAATDTRQLLNAQQQADEAYAQKNCQRAMPLYRELADELEENAYVLLRLGNCFVREKRLEEAMAAYRQALLSDPGFVKAWYNLSYIQAKMLARTVSEMSANVDPADPNAARARLLANNILQAFQNDKAQNSPPPKTDSTEESDGAVAE